MQDQFQAIANRLSKEAKRTSGKDLGIQIGWKSESESFAVAAGRTLNRDVTPDDTFLFGSGTKAVVAAAVMRLADAKRINLHDKVSKFIDPFLLRIV